jgi:peroxiredoxin
MEPHRAGGAAILALAVGIVFLLLRDGMTGRVAPGFSLREAYGGQVQLQSYRGRPVLLVFWTTSCGICRRELPLLDRLAGEFRGRGVEVLAINVGDLEGARQFMREKHLSLTTLVDMEGAVARDYAVSGVPKLVLVGADGRIKRARAGMQSERAVRQWLESVTRSGS